jgi:TolB protein
MQLTQVSSDAGFEGEPSFAPDGRTMVYVSDRNGNFEIYLRQLSGGPDINLTSNEADDVQPAVSPDGQSIAFVSSRSGRSLRSPAPESRMLGGDIYVMPALGGPARWIAEGNFPSWSPDARSIVFVSGRWFNRRLYVVPASGGNPQEIPVAFDERAGDARGVPGQTPDFLTPRFSPDARFISLTFQGGIYTIPAGGGSARLVAEGRDAAWMGSTALVFTSGEPGRRGSLCRLPLSPDTAQPAGPISPLTIARGQDGQAAVTADGSQVVFAAIDRSANLERLRLDADGRPGSARPEPLTTGSNLIYFASFSPDATAVVYGSGRSRTLWRVSPGEAPVKLTAGDHIDSYPRWAPDGRTVAFIRRPASDPGSPAILWVMRADGSAPRSLNRAAFNGFFSWMPDGRIVFPSPTDRQLYSLDIGSGQVRQLTKEAGVMPVSVVSADGRWIVFQSVQEARGNVVLRAIRTDTDEQPRTVVDLPDDSAYHPSLSPDGQWLYFTPDHRNLFRVPGPAQGWRQHAPVQVTSFPESGLFIEDPQVSPDGRWLLYSRQTMAADLWTGPLR